MEILYFQKKKKKEEAITADANLFINIGSQIISLKLYPSNLYNKKLYLDK